MYSMSTTLAEINPPPLIPIQNHNSEKNHNDGAKLELVALLIKPTFFLHYESNYFKK